MLLGTKKNLQDKLVEYLSRKPMCTAMELWQVLCKEKKGNDYTVQAVYKELRGLQAEGVVVKTGRVYSIRLPWASELAGMAEDAHKRSIHAMMRHMSGKLGGGKMVWKFQSLLRLNEAWSQVLLGLVERSENKVLLGWNPHLWFHLLRTEQESQYIHYLDLSGGRLFLIVGGKEYLDRLATQAFPSKGVKYSLGHSPFLQHDDLYVHVIGDAIVTVKMDKAMTDRIDVLYEKTRSMKDISLCEVASMLSQPVKVSLTLEQDKKKALAYRKKFAAFFGEKGLL